MRSQVKHADCCLPASASLHVRSARSHSRARLHDENARADGRPNLHVETNKPTADRASTSTTPVLTIDRACRTEAPELTADRAFTSKTSRLTAKQASRSNRPKQCRIAPSTPNLYFRPPAGVLVVHYGAMPLSAVHTVTFAELNACLMAVDKLEQIVCPWVHEI